MATQSPENKEMTLAEQLHQIANQKQVKNIQMMVNEIVMLTLSRAKEFAEKGSYTCSFYDERLIEQRVANGVRSHLELDGFKVQIDEDKSYSRTEEKRMMRVQLSW